jgi:hypothetical protein
VFCGRVRVGFAEVLLPAFIWQAGYNLVSPGNLVI